jgi:hypothetical protein
VSDPFRVRGGLLLPRSPKWSYIQYAPVRTHVFLSKDDKLDLSATFLCALLYEHRVNERLTQKRIAPGARTPGQVQDPRRPKIENKIICRGPNDNCHSVGSDTRPEKGSDLVVNIEYRQRRPPYDRGGYRKMYRIIMRVATSSIRFPMEKKSKHKKGKY